MVLADRSSFWMEKCRRADTGRLMFYTMREVEDRANDDSALIFLGIFR
jgi:hypothetical protein